MLAFQRLSQSGPRPVSVAFGMALAKAQRLPGVTPSLAQPQPNTASPRRAGCPTIRTQTSRGCRAETTPHQCAKQKQLKTVLTGFNCVADALSQHLPLPAERCSTLPKKETSPVHPVYETCAILCHPPLRDA